MSITPSIDFDRYNTVDIYNIEGYNPPLFVDPIDNKLHIDFATSTKAGIISTSQQNMAGKKIFDIRPECSYAHDNDQQLTSKSYVDSLHARNIGWQPSIKRFLNFENDPSPIRTNPSNGDRVISITTYSNFTENYIYEYVVDAWVEYEPLDGWALYVVDDDSPVYPNKSIVYSIDSSVGSWVNIGLGLDHTNLTGVVYSGSVGVHINDQEQTFLGVKKFSNTTSSTSSTSGCLITSGGIGVGENLIAGGSVFCDGDVLLGSSPTKYYSDSTGCFIFDCLKMREYGGITTITSYATPSSGNWQRLQFSPYDYLSQSYLTIESNKVTIPLTLESTSTSTGSFIVGGGVGIGGNLNVGGITTVLDTTETTALNNGSLIVGGGMSIYKNITVGGSCNFSKGYIFNGGGASVTANTYALKDLVLWDETTHTNDSYWKFDLVDNGVDGRDLNITQGGWGDQQFNMNAISNFQDVTESTSPSTGSLITLGGLGIAKNIFIGGNCNITSTTASTSTSTGSIVISGGAGIAGNLNVGGYIKLNTQGTYLLNSDGLDVVTNLSDYGASENRSYVSVNSWSSGLALYTIDVTAG